MKNSNLLNRLLSFSHEKQSPQRFARYAAILVMLLTIGVGQMWADRGFEDSNNGILFSRTPLGGSAADYRVEHGRTNTTQDAGTVSALTIKEWYAKLYQNWDEKDNIWGDGNFYYRVYLQGGSAPSFTTSNKDYFNWNNWDSGWRKPTFGRTGMSTNVLSGLASGKYYFEYYWDASGSSTMYCNNGSTANFKIKFNIKPTALTSFSVSRSGYSAGSGTSEDPYIIARGGSLTLTASGSGGTSDANSSIKYKYGSSDWQTTSYTISNITSTTKTSITVKGARRHNSQDYGGDESSVTIYYKAETTYSVSVSSGTPSSVYAGANYTTPTITASDVTGYHFDHWSATSGITITDADASPTRIKATATGTVTAYYEPNTYTITLHDNNGQADNGSATATYDSNTLTDIDPPTKTGYNVEGYYTSSNCTTKVATTAGALQNSITVSETTWTNASGQWKATEGKTFYADWTAKNYSVTLDKNGGDSDGSVTTTYNSSSSSSFSGASYAGHSCTGYYDDPDDGEGSLIINANGTIPSSTVSGWLSSGTWVKDGADITLYAHWEVDLTYYDVTFGVGTSYTSLGSLSAKVTSTSAAITSGDDLVSGTGITFTATPETGYEVDGFYSDASCETELQSGTTTTYTIASLSSDVTVYVKFVEKTWSVAFAAGVGGSVTTPNSTPQTVGQVTGISIAATNSSGYTFDTWTITSGSGSFASSASTNSNTFYPTAASTITASFNETMHTVTKTKCTGSSSVGIATAATVTCSSAPAGKKFNGWSISGTYTLTSGTLSSRTISFTATTDVTVTATYVDRTYKTVYFAKPSGWTSGLKVYAWDGKNTPTYENADWPGVEVTTTESVKGTTYHYYKFYTDNNGEGDNQTGAANWTKIIFSKKGDTSTKTEDLTLTNAHYYHIADGQGESGRAAATVSGSTSAEDWYVCGYWNESTDDWGFANPIALNGTTSGNVTKTVTASLTQEFKIFRASTNQWFKYTGGADADYYDNYAALIGSPMTLREYNANRNYFTSVATEYRFTLDITSTSNPVLTVAPATDNDYSATISVHEDGHGSIDPVAGGITLHQYTPTTITATPQAGYRFKQWNVSGCTVTSSTSATTTAYATANGGTIEAEFTQEGIIYFDNTMSQWKGDIYVYLFTMDKNTRNPWWETMDASSNGPGIVLKKKDGSVMYQYSGKMIRIGESNIYYFNYKDAGCSSTVYQAVFTKGDFGTSAGLYKTSAAYRADFNACMPMYIASQTWTTTNETGYHNSGYWKRYNVKNSGLTLRGLVDKNSNGNNWDEADEIEFTSTEENSNTFKASVTLGNATHQFKIYHPCVSSLGWLGNKGTMQPNNSTGWEMTETDNCQIYVPSTGTYVFTLNLGTDHIYLSVEYPLLANDYHLLYTGRITTTGSDSHKHDSQSIRHLTGNNKEQRDTVSFFIDKDHKGTLQLQKCTNPAGNGGRGTWADTAVVVSLSDIDKTGIYNFEIVQTTNASGIRTTTANILDAEHRKYNGDLYIRTDVADGGWEAYEQVRDNMLVYSDYAKSYSNYDYYHCHWTPTSKNLHFTIANDYSPSVSDTMKTGATPFNFENLPYEASVRFMYNSATNELNRAYLNGSNEGEAEYLKIQALHGTVDSIQTAAGAAFPAANRDGDTIFVKFSDLGNWVYQYELKAKEGTHYRLISDYYYSSTHHLQYFKGTQSATWNPSTTEQLIGGTGSSYQKLRLVYDFKSNNLMAAWMPDGEVDSDLAIHADMMLIRRAQNAATQLTFTSGMKLSDVKTMVGVVEFFKDSIVGRVNDFSGDVDEKGGNRAYRELMLYISFPFDVAVNDIYGCGDYNKEWYIQYYDGAERARKGWFKGDGTTTFWKFIDRSDTLRAGVGYSLLLDNDYFKTDNAGVWKNIADGGSVYLFFPSTKELDSKTVIKSGSAALTVHSHECTIDRTFVSANSGRTVNHKFTDSHWNMIGVPLFQNQTGVETTKFIAEIESENPQDLIPFPENQGYFYEWDSLANTLSVRSTSGYTFKSMHGYMVQFTGTVEFTGSSIQPASVAARRAQLNKNYTIELQLLQNARQVSRTYVELREEACDTFALNEDMYMLYTSRPADLFTYAGNYDVSANVLSENNHIVPVGIEVHKAGTFTFTMPSNFSGTATLIDTHTQTRTNLAISNYEVTLPKGVCDGRFFLELDINKVTTDVKEVTGDGLRVTGVRKYIYDNQLYIMKNGMIYDARGNRVK